MLIVLQMFLLYSNMESENIQIIPWLKAIYVATVGNAICHYYQCTNTYMLCTCTRACMYMYVACITSAYLSVMILPILADATRVTVRGRERARIGSHPHGGRYSQLPAPSRHELGQH